MSNEEDFWIDDTFRVQETRFKMWKSYDKRGNEIILSLDREGCISATRFYLKGKLEGFSDPISTHDGFVGGKL
jgi:hypothetical protein